MNPAEPVTGRRRRPKHIIDEENLKELLKRYVAAPVEGRNRIQFLRDVQCHLLQPKKICDEEE